MKKWEKALQKPWVAYTFAACVAVILFLILSNLAAVKGALSVVLNIISPIITGIIVAYLFNPVSDFFEKKLFKKIKKESTRHIFGVTLSIVCIVLALAILLLALIPSLAQSITKLVRNWTVYTKKLQDIVKVVAAFAQKHNINIDLSNIQNLIDNAMHRAIDFVKGNYKSIFTALGDVGKGVSNFVIGIMFGFCFLIAKKSLLRFLGKLRAAVSPKSKIEKRNALWKRSNTIFLRYIGSTLLDALIIGVATLIFMLIAKMPYAPLISVVVGLTNIIPTFGPLIGNLIGVFFLILESPLQALIFFIFTCVLQSVDGMVIKPKLFSGSLGIPAVWTLVLIILGGKIAGIAGILLAVPLAAVFVILYHETIVPRLEKRTQKINAPSPEEAPPEAESEEERTDPEPGEEKM